VKKRGRDKSKTKYCEQDDESICDFMIRESGGVFPAYRKLKVWNKAHENFLAIITLLEPVPDNPVSARIKDQLIGSASSIGANIAEGSGIYRGAKFCSYLQIALDSACETDNWLQVFKDSEVLNRNIDKELLESILVRNHEVIKMLIKLIDSIERKRQIDYTNLR
jgi:four helix bundle protein